MTNHVLFSTQKNEGPFLLEWLAYHSLIGFDKFVIVSNDCSDGSDVLLDAMASVLPLEHIRQDLKPGQNAQRTGQQLARDTGVFENGEWVAWLDIDEFLNSHIGSGHVAQLTEAMGPAQAIAMNWRLFGSAGVQRWPGLQLDSKFDRCGTSWHKSSRYCKTLFKYSDDIERMHMHRPTLVPHEPDDPPVLWLDSEGEALPQEYILGRRENGAPYFRTPRRPHYKWVQVNHYMVRVRHLYKLRQMRGRGVRVGEIATRKGRRHTWMHYQKHNCNTLRDRSIHQHLPELRAKIEELMSVPAVRNAHQACLSANGLL